MMSQVKGSTASANATGNGHATGAPVELSAEEKSKDEFFVQLAEIAEAMSKRHGKEFAMGALVLAARFIAENKPLVR